MAKKEVHTFTAVSYIEEKSGDKSVCVREEVVFEQTQSPKGTYHFQPVSRTAFLSDSEQAESDKKMMEHAGEILSDYLSRIQK